MARDKTTKKGIGLIDDSAPASEDFRPPDTGVKRIDRTPSTRPGFGVDDAQGTRPGVRPDSSPARNKSTYFQDSAPSAPVSRRDIKERLATERGVGITPEKKLITKPGVAPPSDPPPPPSEPPPPWDEITQEAPVVLDEVPAQAQAPSMESLRDEQTPVGEYRAAEEGETSPEGGERSQFRTARGGGKNRVSGGRAAAAAYMSPSTLPPGHGAGKITSAVKVHEKVQEDARTFPTEPSLMRRRQSSLPPPLPPGYGKHPIPWRWISGGVVFVAGVLAVVWLLRQPAAPIAELPPAQNSEELRNAAPAGPMQEEMAPPAPEKITPPASAAQPEPPSQVPAPSQALAPAIKAEPSPQPAATSKSTASPTITASPPQVAPTPRVVTAPPVVPTPPVASQPRVAPSPKAPEKKSPPHSEDPWLD